VLGPKRDRTTKRFESTVDPGWRQRPVLMTMSRNEAGMSFRITRGRSWLPRSMRRTEEGRAQVTLESRELESVPANPASYRKQIG
jgi:hypothetical protein